MELLQETGCGIMDGRMSQWWIYRKTGQLDQNWIDVATLKMFNLKIRFNDSTWIQLTFIHIEIWALYPITNNKSTIEIECELFL